MDAGTIRRTAVGAAVGGGVFGAAGVARSMLAEGALGTYLGPVAFFSVLGLTVGGLAGPLVGRALARRRARRSEDDPDEGGAR